MKGARTRERILDAAELEFAKSGFSGARISNIAKYAACPTALVHHYFRDKESLYADVIARAASDMTRDVSAVLGTLKSAIDASRTQSAPFARSEIEALVAAFVHALSTFYEQHGPMLTMLHRDESEPKGSDVFETSAKTLFDESVKQLEALARTGALREGVDAREVCLAAVALIMFPTFDRPLYERLATKSTREARDACCTRVILRMIL
jgi:AcrR family transcriptional regulator